MSGFINVRRVRDVVLGSWHVHVCCGSDFPLVGRLEYKMSELDCMTV